jgi:hypothetical protein
MIFHWCKVGVVARRVERRFRAGMFVSWFVTPTVQRTCVKTNANRASVNCSSEV